MGKNVLFKPNQSGIIALLKSKDMENLVLREAQKYASADSEVHTFIGFDRVHAVVEGNKND